MARDITVKIGKDHYKTEIQVEQHNILADEPIDVGGTDLGPSPTEFLMSSVGTCKAITVRMYADRKNWELEAVRIRMSIGAQEGELQKTTFIKCHIELIGNLNETQRKRLLTIADKCPVHKILINPIIIESNLM
ncbi:OsmC family protein [Sphingobacterium suaedae]|uniref:OsmC family protein n=1 Tax=Sphingobacterium suaedae TaxID=1686402 RepID=A0ABW5KDI6_9SPHI